ncbi:Threonine/homoserine/homoserine lactone efflux protein [Rhodovulum sp. ES.010]|uniref:LysE family translocator n=1 Tax=Rhodovulum sp. ES.010 TaxID=1882821 RepID=UPI000929F3C2|nr:LysE family translocator [Rhodovulum sp. ES.010]SIO34555.1 Threonine/homoserine/homoserine lactone efflux protein [Rhodovulum sp. ES.010]
MELLYLSFALVVFITAATPGPTVLLALTNGSRFGVPRATFGMLGAAASDLVLISAAALGLGAVLAASAFWFNVVKWIGVGYLAWLGFQLLRARGELGVELHGAAEGKSAPVAAPHVLFRKSFLVAVTNPKGYMFVAALLPQFIDQTAPLAPQYVMLAIIFVCIDLLVMATYAGLGVGMVKFLAPARVILLERCSGGVLIALAGILATTRRAT